MWWFATCADLQFNCVKKFDKYKIRCTLAVELLRSWALQVIYTYSIQLNLPGATYDRIMTTWNCHCMSNWCEHFASTDLIVQIQFKFYRFLQSPQQLEAKLASLQIPRELVHWSGQFIDHWGRIWENPCCQAHVLDENEVGNDEWSDGLCSWQNKVVPFRIFFGSQDASWWLKSFVHWHHEVCLSDRSGFITRNKEFLKKRRGKRHLAIPTLESLVVGESQ